MSLERWALDPENHWPNSKPFRQTSPYRTQTHCLECGKFNGGHDGIGGCCSDICYAIWCDRGDCS